ncbi:hypothetical protein [Actinomadura roseirufa]|uniref:hypothetical protein n=1 Tax=Actinomadura roseirufa TaxID=2094049 RepID=UPI001041865A|nr:hypothetical protein [Actinomadura roseirufa]
MSLTKDSTARADDGAETTRHLCAATYLDRGFRDMIITKVLADHRHRVAPSYGFDLVAVTAHAWRAWRLDAVKHACVLTVLAVTAAGSPAAVVAAICGAVLPWLVCRTAVLAPQVLTLKAKLKVVQFLRKHATIGELEDSNRLQERLQLLKLATSGCVVASAVPVVAAGADGTPLSQALARAGIAMALMVIAIALVSCARYRAITTTRTGHSLRPRRLDRRLRAIELQQNDHVVVYRRPEPRKGDGRRTDAEDDGPGFFVGSGRLVHRWLPPLAIQLVRPKSTLPAADEPDALTRREYRKPPFDAHELVRHLIRTMQPIGHSSDRSRLPGYRINQRVFVAEADAPFAGEQIRAGLGLHALPQIINEPHGPLQHFLEIRVTSSGELVTTVFLRVTVKGRSLSLDFAACALPRTPPEFERFARPTQAGRATLVRDVLLDLRRLHVELGCTWQILRAPGTLLRVARARRSQGPAPVTAPQLSIREEVAAEWDRADFDKPTILDQMKILELRLLETTKDFLRSHNVDTSAFEKRAETIISASVLNMGGHMEIRDSAIGDGAQVNRNTPVMEGAQS